MTAKDQNSWSLGQLEEWAKPALDYPELIWIARTATSNTEAKNLALEFTKERGLEEKVAMACRWLRILRVEHLERFEGLISQVEQKSKEEKEMGKIEEGQESHCEKKEFFLGSDNEVIFKMGQSSAIWIRFFNREEARRFCCSVLSFAAGLSDKKNLLESDVHPFNQITPEKLRDLMIKILGEKFGCKVIMPKEVSEKNKSELKTEGLKVYCKKCGKTVTMIDLREGDDGDLISVVGKCPYCDGNISTFIGK